MPRTHTWRSVVRALTVYLCASMAGCAAWQGPRIDPTGDRLFVWPGETPAPIAVGPAVMGPPITPPPGTFVAPPPGSIVAPPPGTVITPAPAIVVPPTNYALPFGNLQAPPVYPDPVGGPTVVGPPIITAPGVVVPGGPTPVVPVPTGPPAPVIPPGTVTPMGVVVPSGLDQLRVSPERIIAPVCSEVVLKAAICGSDGYLVANQPIEWSLDRSGPGQFGNMTTSDATQLLSWWDEPRRVDNWTVLSSTAQETVRLYRGTPDPRDDVQILRGDTWVAVTSAQEGTSVITACAPSINGQNRTTAVIQWVDADWVFPAAATVVEAGRPHVLTTTVVRRSNGAPLPGWTVRYDVATGASLGYGGGNSVEVPTDANGRASVEVSPTDAGGGAATVGISIVSPAISPTDAGGRLELSRTTTTLTWQRGAPVVAPPADAGTLPPTVGNPADVPPSLSQPPVSPPPTFSTPGSTGVSPPPAATTPANPYAPSAPPSTTPDPYSPAPTSPDSPTAPPSAAQPAGRPALDVQLRRIGPEQVAVGEYVSFDVVITNTGDGAARGILVEDRFDRGLRHPRAKPNEYGVRFNDTQELAPNASRTVKLTFQVIEGGQHCHEVTVSTEGALPVSRKECISAKQAALEVRITGPRRQIVGESAVFSAYVKNVGDVPATNIELVFDCDPAIVPTSSENEARGLPGGGVLIKIDKLEPGEFRPSLRMEGRCATASNRACVRVHVNADGGVTASAEACVEVLPLMQGVIPDTQRAGDATAPAASSNLKLTITETSNPGRVREKQTVYVTVENVGQQIERNVAVRVSLPQDLAPDATQIQPAAEATVLQQEIRFSAIAELRPGDSKRYVIPVTPTRAGQSQVRAQIKSDSLTTPTTIDSDIIQILP